MALSDYQKDKANALNLFREKIRSELSLKSSDELSYILGRYCGPSNQFLSEKTFGYIMPKDIVEEVMIQKIFEEEILGSEG